MTKEEILNEEFRKGFKKDLTHGDCILSAMERYALERMLELITNSAMIFREELIQSLTTELNKLK